MIKISDYVLLGVLGCPYIGINHLTNMISSSPHIAPKAITDDYDAYLYNHYNNIQQGPNHIEVGWHQMGVDDYTQAEEWIKSQALTTVLCIILKMLFG